MKSILFVQNSFSSLFMSLWCTLSCLYCVFMNPMSFCSNYKNAIFRVNFTQLILWPFPWLNLEVTSEPCKKHQNDRPFLITEAYETMPWHSCTEINELFFIEIHLTRFIMLQHECNSFLGESKCQLNGEGLNIHIHILRTHNTQIWMGIQWFIYFSPIWGTNSPPIK